MDMTLPPLGELAARCAPAQRIEYGRDHFAAFPMHAVLELVDAPRVRQVPGAAVCCDRLLAWQHRWLPLLDLQALLQPHETPTRGPLRYALVVAWQPAPRAPLRHAALALPATPVVVTVDDAARCALPLDSGLWPWIAKACFVEGARVVPVLDAGRLFGPLPQLSRFD